MYKKLFVALILAGSLSADPLGYFEQKINTINFE